MSALIPIALVAGADSSTSGVSTHRIAIVNTTSVAPAAAPAIQDHPAPAPRQLQKTGGGRRGRQAPSRTGSPPSIRATVSNDDASSQQPVAHFEESGQDEVATADSQDLPLQQKARKGRTMETSTQPARRSARSRK